MVLTKIGIRIFQNPLKTLMIKERTPEKATISDLWKYGISGDLIIILVMVQLHFQEQYYQNNFIDFLWKNQRDTLLMY